MRLEADRLAPVTGAEGEPADHGGTATIAALFPIRVVARLTGINPVTIRAWERRYRLVRPERTPGGHRLYSRADVELLRAASRLVDQGVSISRATRLLEAPLQHHDDADELTLERLLERLADLDGDGMSAVLEAFLARHSRQQATTLLDRLPAAAAGLPPLERHWLEGWLEGLLAFRIYQRMAQPGEPRVLVCPPAVSGLRTWSLVLALGLAEAGVRPVVLAAPAGADLVEAVRRGAFGAVVLAAAPEGRPRAAELGVPAFCGNGPEGFLPLSPEPAAARRRVLEALGPTVAGHGGAIRP